MGLYPFNPNEGQKIQGAGITTPALGMGYIAHYSQPTPAALSAAGCHALLTLTAGAQAGVITGFTNPDVARNVSIVAGTVATTGSTVTVYGTNINGDAISETLVTNGTTKVVGNKAFATVTKADFPAQTSGGGESISIGFDNKLGLYHKLTANTVLFAFLNKVKEGTAPTVAVSSTVLESNTAILNSALNASQVDLYYVVGT